MAVRPVPVPRPFRFALALLCAAVLLAGCGDARLFPEGSPASGEEIRATISRVVDGDTVDVQLETGAVEQVRVIGINTPETVGPRRPVECYGREASARARELLGHSQIALMMNTYSRVLPQLQREAADRMDALLAVGG